jgi:hypothetical protein
MFGVQRYVKIRQDVLGDQKIVAKPVFDKARKARKC